MYGYNKRQRNFREKIDINFLDILNEKINPLVSIIMNCHNGEKYLSKSISSIFSQSYKNWELIFFDNNSNDNSKKIIKVIKIKELSIFLVRKK